MVDSHARVRTASPAATGQNAAAQASRHQGSVAADRMPSARLDGEAASSSLPFIQAALGHDEGPAWYSSLQATAKTSSGEFLWSEGRPSSPREALGQQARLRLQRTGKQRHKEPPQPRPSSKPADRDDVRALRDLLRQQLAHSGELSTPGSPADTSSSAVKAALPAEVAAASSRSAWTTADDHLDRSQVAHAWQSVFGELTRQVHSQ